MLAARGMLRGWCCSGSCCCEGGAAACSVTVNAGEATTGAAALAWVPSATLEDRRRTNHLFVFFHIRSDLLHHNHRIILVFVAVRAVPIVAVQVHGGGEQFFRRGVVFLFVTVTVADHFIACRRRQVGGCIGVGRGSFATHLALAEVGWRENGAQQNGNEKAAQEGRAKLPGGGIVRVGFVVVMIVVCVFVGGGTVGTTLSRCLRSPLPPRALPRAPPRARPRAVPSLPALTKRRSSPAGRPPQNLE